MSADWLLYGATGFTGQLLVEEAVRRGHRPLLAGRSAEKLAPLAEQFGLNWAAVSLTETVKLAQLVAKVKLVFHAAGPYVHTAAPMRQACLTAGTHYLDITGELPVFEQTFACHQQAMASGIALLPGVGFDVIPTDCLICHVAEQLENPVELTVAVAPNTRASAGTTKAGLEMLPAGIQMRRTGRLMPAAGIPAIRQIQFSHQTMSTMLTSWGDLSTAFRSTGIPNITTYMAYPGGSARLMRLLMPLARKALANSGLRAWVKSWVTAHMQGPDKAMRQNNRSYIWAQATDAHGATSQAWLETMEAYQFTAVAGIRCVEQMLAQPVCGALSPAQAFGPDFVMSIAGTRRFDVL